VVEQILIGWDPTDGQRVWIPEAAQRRLGFPLAANGNGQLIGNLGQGQVADCSRAIGLERYPRQVQPRKSRDQRGQRGGDAQVVAMYEFKRCRC
jgi:hypothetical protein